MNATRTTARRFAPTPYTLNIDAAEVEELRRRLAATRWPQQLPGVDGWTKGVPVADAKAWAGFIPMGPVDEATIAGLTGREQRRLQLISQFLQDGNGYNVIQATRPQTIGYGLEDLPAARLTRTVEKVTAWTHDQATLADPHYRARHLATCCSIG